jgi:GMP synthase (glutamine-hydrolysing)
VRVLAVVHGELVGPAIFGEVVEARGHELEIWCPASRKEPVRPLDTYGAVLVFGGVMDAHEEALYPWLRDENAVLEQLLELEAPVLGICLGAQLLAKAAQGIVEPAPEPEVGWHEIELTQEALTDALFMDLPNRLFAFEWHYYRYRTPESAVELARSRECPQAFRLGRFAWGVQFHPEVTERQILVWLSQGFATPTPPALIAAETRRRIDDWNAFGRTLCRRFLDIAASAHA